MKLPEKVKVGAMVYSVQIVPNMYADREMYGEVIYGQQIIKIAGDISEARQFNAFLHELTHAILFESGDMSDHDEAYVRRFSNLLTQVILDNGWTVGHAQMG